LYSLPVGVAFGTTGGDVDLAWFGFGKVLDILFLKISASQNRHEYGHMVERKLRHSYPVMEKDDPASVSR